MKACYRIHCKPRQEYLAQENLERQGYGTYLPVTSVRRRKRGKSVSEVAPMFPRYLFIHLSDTTDDWGPIRSTIGVANLVRFAHSPACVPDKLIDALKQREDSKGVQILTNTGFQRGEKVRIAEGSFEGYEAIFQANTSKDRVILLLQIAEKQISLKLDESLIESYR